MKKTDIGGLLNRIAIAVLLLASAAFYVQRRLKAKGDRSFVPGPNLSQPAVLASFASAFFIFPQQNLINHKPIYLCVK